MLIGELVVRSGLSKDTIRFYEKKGLIKLERKNRRDNNYKEYPAEVPEKLSLIGQLKNIGFTLNEIDSFIKLWDDDGASFTLEKKLVFIAEQIKKMTALKCRLEESLTK